MKEAKILKHTLKLEFECPELEKKFIQIIQKPYISQGEYYSDWQYTAVTFTCKFCGKSHSFEI